MDIFLHQLIQFYSNNATNLHHLTTHSTTMLPYKMAIVLRPQICDVISPYVYVQFAELADCMYVRYASFDSAV